MNIFKEKQMFSKFFNWLFNNNVPKNEEAAMPAAWPFPVSDKFEQAVEVTTPKVARKPKPKAKATTTKKKAPAKAKAKAKATTTKTKKTTTKKPSK